MDAFYGLPNGEDGAAPHQVLSTFTLSMQAL